MANTYTQIHIQCVMAVKYRASLIHPDWKDQLQKYITGIVQNYGHKMLAINNMPDHLHLFFGFRPNQSLSDLMRIVKSESSRWINDKQFTPAIFNWQEGYGAFSYSRSHVQKVIEYVLNQEEHHRHKTFIEEYEQFLTQFEIDYNERYIFKLPE
ncbi:MAG TPA: IS200/IS605 family transposase [Mucilaginibacter sp.]|nr:IS200/IS605 family transposase [Mucilaginibacter sp.]